MSDQEQPLHLRSEGFWTDNAPDVPPSEWYARCTAGVLHDPQGESVVCLCGLDAKEWPDGLETGDGAQVSGLPRVEGPPTFLAWGVHPTVPAEGFVQEVDGVRLDLADGDSLGVDRDAGVSPDPHGVGAAADPDAAIRVDDSGEISEDERVHNVPLSGGGEDTPFYRDEWLTIYLGDCRDRLQALPDESVHCVISSPPYWGLRDYGTDGQLGLEPTPEAYVENMVAVFREVRRVLRSDGTVWLNLGDSYASHDPGGYREGEFLNPEGRPAKKGTARNRAGNYRPSGLKPKDLVGIPWRVAFALQADGWYLRSDIIWAKPNPMPESVTDRPTKAHEYLFLLSKGPRYFFDMDAVREPHTSAMELWRQEHGRLEGQGPKAVEGRESENGTANRRGMGDPAGRNIRTVWTIATAPYPGAHFATFPPKLVEPCIKAGTSEKGVCPECGAPWERVVETVRGPAPKDRGGKNYGANAQGTSPSSALRKVGGDEWYEYAGQTTTTGWQPSCRCAKDGVELDSVEFAGWAPVPATVLDCFAGSGTTGMVANHLSRRAVLIDLNADYLGQVLERNRQAPLGLGA